VQNYRESMRVLQNPHAFAVMYGQYDFCKNCRESMAPEPVIDTAKGAFVLFADSSVNSGWFTS
jgi:hypothetical protein